MANSPCIYWGDGQAGENHFDILTFRSFYTPLNNFDCFTDPFAWEQFERWVGPDGSEYTPDDPNAGYNIEWEGAQSPRAFWNQNWNNIDDVDGTHPTCTVNEAEQYPCGPGLGMIHVASFEGSND